jgi:predicted dehydrogenase
MKEVISIGVAGLGGYAGAICSLLEKHSRGDQPAVKLVAVCEPDHGLHAPRIAELRAAGIKVLQRYEDLLAEPIEAVWLPVPIDLHRPFTEQALAAGKAVMCEKPAAGCIDDVDAMIAARDRSGRAVAIGFQDIYNPLTVDLKRRVLKSEIGRITSATVWGCWPRNSSYYGRASWAGGLQRNGVWVLDSPANNALAHQINLALFLLGTSLTESAMPLEVEAELYRANPIENYDTCALRLKLPGDIPLLVMLTHACARQIHPQIELRGPKGSIRWKLGEHIQITAGDNEQTIPLPPHDWDQIIRRFAQYVRGTLDDGVVATLEMARCHSAVISGASEAAAVHTVPESFVQTIMLPEGERLRAITGVEELFKQCAASGQMPHETGRAEWSVPTGRKDLRGYHHFAGPAGGASLRK